MLLILTHWNIQIRIWDSGTRIQSWDMDSNVKWEPNLLVAKIPWNQRFTANWSGSTKLYCNTVAQHGKCSIYSHLKKISCNHVIDHDAVIKTLITRNFWNEMVRENFHNFTSCVKTQINLEIFYVKSINGWFPRKIREINLYSSYLHKK